MFSTLGYFVCIPFAWLVKIFYNMTGSYGMAIVLFTLVVKLIMMPFQIKSKKSMIRMNRMSGRMQEIQKKYANNQIKANEEIQKLYAEEGINPMSGCVWSFLPLPILIALYSIIRQPITHFMLISKDTLESMVAAATTSGMDMSKILNFAKDGSVAVSKGYSQFTPYGQINFVRAIAEQMPELGSKVDGWINVNYNFLGLDLANNPMSMFKSFNFSWACIGLILIPILAGASQLIMSVVMMKQQPSQGAGGASTKGMMYMMPLFSVYIAFMMPAALGVYWIAQSVFSLIQEIIMNKFFTKKIEEEEAARYEAIQADRKRRMEEGRVQQEQRKLEVAQKQSLREKQQAAQSAKAEKAKKAAVSTTEAGRVGERPYARGRSYKEDRYDN